jgi:hypothetical protein
MNIDLRGKLFSAFGPVPGQLSRSLGGYGGVRGGRDMPFTVARGDRLALLSVEVRRRLPDMRYIGAIMSTWHLLVFMDVGLLDDADRKSSPLGFLDTGLDEWRKTVGLGISGESFLPYFGLYVAQDLDRDRFEPRFILRFNRSF